MSTHGVHGPNAPWGPEDYLLTTAARADAVKLMWYHGAEDVRELRRRGVTRFLVRLPDSTAEQGRWKGLDEWLAECRRIMVKFLGAGVTDFQLDNEPNETWPNAAPAVANWRWLTTQVAGRLRAAFPTTRLGLAPFAWNPGTWARVEGLWAPAMREAAGLFQFACVNSYWQADEHYNDPGFGGNATHWHDALLPGTPVVVTEWACSSDAPPGEVEARRARDYPRWRAWVDTKDYVEADYLFILSGTPDWAKFWPTDRVLRAL